MFVKSAVIVLIALAVTRFASADREHKVHNIVLYPERHSWCQTTAIKQIVSKPGYKSTTIDNNVCVGACYSYSIPRTQPAEPGELIGPYCDSCQPLATQCYHVTLTADRENTDPAKMTVQKRVQIITNCSCTSCSKIQTTDCEIADQSTSELPTNLFALLHPNRTEIGIADVPELLNLSPPTSQTQGHTLLTPNATTDEQRYEINSKLIQLLKSIQNQEEDEDISNLNYDREQLRELLDIIEGSEHRLSDKNLMDFVNFVNVHNSEDLELDLTRLKEVLNTFMQEDLVGRHREFGLGKNADVQGKKYSIPKTPESHLKGNHHFGMGIKRNDLEEGPDVKAKIESPGHHHLGEVQEVGVHHMGHLIHGPHNSLVLVPDEPKVEEKLNLDSDEVRPNHEGVVISYENHHKRTPKK